MAMATATRQLQRLWVGGGETCKRKVRQDCRANWLGFLGRKGGELWRWRWHQRRGLQEQRWRVSASGISYGWVRIPWTATWCSITSLCRHSTTALAIMSSWGWKQFTLWTRFSSRKACSNLVTHHILWCYVVALQITWDISCLGHRLSYYEFNPSWIICILGCMLGWNAYKVACSIEMHIR